MYTAPMSDASRPAATPDRRVADALPDHWADRLLPLGLRPYARLMRLERCSLTPRMTDLSLCI